MIIGINGYAGSGKDTVGTIIQYLKAKPQNTSLEDVLDFPLTHQWWLEDMSTWEIKKWAGKLKSIASMLTGIPQESFEDQEFKKKYLGSQWAEAGYDEDKKMHSLKPMTVRDFLQRLGTDAIRNGLHTNAWVNALMADYTPTQVQWSDGPIGGYEDGPMPNWIITDTRFPNEAQAIKDADGIIIRVTRPGIGPVNDHPSETGLNQWKFDYEIQNDGTLENLINSVKIFKQKFGI